MGSRRSTVGWCCTPVYLVVMQSRQSSQCDNLPLQRWCKAAQCLLRCRLPQYTAAGYGHDGFLGCDAPIMSLANGARERRPYALSSSTPGSEHQSQLGMIAIIIVTVVSARHCPPDRTSLRTTSRLMGL